MGLTRLQESNNNGLAKPRVLAIKPGLRQFCCHLTKLLRWSYQKAVAVSTSCLAPFKSKIMGWIARERISALQFFYFIISVPNH